MRRLLRILLNAATVLSLVLCAATMAAWVRSYQVRDTAWWSMANPRLLLSIDTCRGGLLAGVSTPNEFFPPGTSWHQWPAMSYTEAGGPQGSLFNRFGFAFYYGRLDCPYWFIMLLAAILPAARLAGWRRRARRLRMGAGLCQHCGYDCRATPDRCPECGTPSAAG